MKLWMKKCIFKECKVRKKNVMRKVAVKVCQRILSLSRKVFVSAVWLLTAVNETAETRTEQSKPAEPENSDFSEWGTEPAAESLKKKPVTFFLYGTVYQFSISFLKIE